MAYLQSMKKRWPIMAGMAVFFAASACYERLRRAVSCRRWRLLCACWVSGCPGGCWPKRWAQSASAFCRQPRLYSACWRLRRAAHWPAHGGLLAAVALAAAGCSRALGKAQAAAAALRAPDGLEKAGCVRLCCACWRCTVGGALRFAPCPLPRAAP